MNYNVELSEDEIQDLITGCASAQFLTLRDNKWMLLVEKLRSTLKVTKVEKPKPHIFDGIERAAFEINASKKNMIWLFKMLDQIDLYGLSIENREGIISLMYDIAYNYMSISQLETSVLILETNNIKVYSLCSGYKYKKCVGNAVDYTNERLYI